MELTSPKRLHQRMTFPHLAALGSLRFISLFATGIV
jgi:hypothetical protein